MKRDDLVWSDRKRNWLGLPWTFTVYGLTEDRLFIKTGVLNIHEDEVRLYRILDLSNYDIAFFPIILCHRVFLRDRG